MICYLCKIVVLDVGMGCMGFFYGYGMVFDYDEVVDFIWVVY